ncbi:hypothetical protein EX30DRAFT_394753 [Ascodesmis nigricans]|uniref:RRM domain-containing protein n=1 Tax=Ascodesmis nigricans TaxID=341454 RepID=A0A4S2N053_9PEZI|nr:hypothetical protein EX30DRAFT_394753 [Ascodesmis nigricans]
MTAPFFNPFKNWPFAFAPGGSNVSNSSIDCSCEVIDGKHYRQDGYPCPTEALFQHHQEKNYPDVLQTSGSKQNQNNDGPDDASKAIEALKAISISQRKPSGKQQKPSGKENVDASSAVRSHKDENVSKATASQNTPTEGQDQQPVPGKGIFVESTNLHAHEPPATHRSLLSAPPAISLNTWRGVSNLHNVFTPMPAVPEIATPVKEGKGKERTIWSSPNGPSIAQYLGTHGLVHPGILPSSPPNDKTAVKPENYAPSTPKGHGKLVLGCSQCLFNPKIKAIPCGCYLCYHCCGRFCTSLTTGTTVYCGCGERVVSIVNVPEHTLTTGYITPQTQHPPSTQYSPTSLYSPLTPANHMFASPTSRSIVLSPWKSEPTVPSALHAQALITAAQMSGITNPSLASPGNAATMTRMLAMDAESAIHSAPFVELGKQTMKQAWACVKIGNIPYNVTSEELMEFLGPNANLVPENMGSIGIHVIMDRSTGKTMDAYAEFISSEDAWKCVSRRRSRVLGNRHLTLEVVDQSELMKDIFPRAKGIVWEGVTPRKEFKADYDTKVEIVNREELTQIVNHAKTPHRSPFSRKCLPRPFQSLMSIVSKFPWFATDLYTIAQRDYIFNAIWTAIDILKRSIKRGGATPNLDVDLLKAVLCVGIRCAGFTDAQKYELVKTAEFGADGVQVDEDIGILSGFEALGKAVGAERRVLEFYALLLELSVSPFLSEPSTQGLAAAELIRARNYAKQHPEESKKAHLTMAEAASMEWGTIERSVRTVLLSRYPHGKSSRRLKH